MSAGATGARPQSVDIVSLAERMGYLQALRVGIACLVLASGILVPDVIGASLTDLILVTSGYLFLAASTEGLRQLERGRGLSIVGGMLLVDGLYLAWVIYSTGGALSPFRFLFYVHLVAVTLLASYVTGLKIALWHSLLFFVVFYAQASGVLDVKEGIAGALPGGGALFTRIALFNITALWTVAIGTAAFSSLNERELRRRKGDVEDLAAMASELENVFSATEICETLLERVCESFGFKRGVVMAGAVDDMSLAAYRGPGEPAEVRPGSDAVVEATVTSREVKLLKRLDSETDPRLSALLPFARNVAVFPMTAEGQEVGVIAVEHTGRSNRIERRVVNIVSQFAAHGALAVQNAWLYEQIQRQAETDALTGIANRRIFESTLEREISRAARNGEQLTLAMFDIDHFKALNDTHGHQAGDDVLKKVATSLVTSCRDFDTPARYGGEEFVVILPSCSTRESLMVAERIRKALSDIDTTTPITASAGVATFPSHAADMTSLIRAADEALYESKRAGRDRVTRSRRRGRSKKAVMAEELSS